MKFFPREILNSLIGPSTRLFSGSGGLLNPSVGLIWIRKIFILDLIPRLETWERCKSLRMKTVYIRVRFSITQMIYRLSLIRVSSIRFLTGRNLWKSLLQPGTPGALIIQYFLGVLFATHFFLRSLNR